MTTSTSPLLSRCCLQPTHSQTQSPQRPQSSSSPSTSPRDYDLNIDLSTSEFESQASAFTAIEVWSDTTLTEVNVLFQIITDSIPELSAVELIQTLNAFNMVMKHLFIQIKRKYVTVERSEITKMHGINVQKAIAMRTPAVTQEMNGKMVVDLSTSISEFIHEVGEELTDFAMGALEGRTSRVAEEMNSDELTKMFSALCKTSHLGGNAEAALIDKTTTMLRSMDIDQIDDLAKWIEASFQVRAHQKCKNGVSDFHMQKLIRALGWQIEDLTGIKSVKAEDITRMLLAFDKCCKIYPLDTKDVTPVLNNCARKLMSLLENMEMKDLIITASHLYKFKDVRSVEVTPLIQAIAERILPVIPQLSPLEINRSVPSFSTFPMDKEVLERVISATAAPTKAHIRSFSFRQCYVLLCAFLESGVKTAEVIEVQHLLADMMEKKISEEGLLKLAEVVIKLSSFDIVFDSVNRIKDALLKYAKEAEFIGIKPIDIASIASLYAVSPNSDAHSAAMITQLCRLALINITIFDTDSVVLLLKAISESPLRNEFLTLVMETFANAIYNKQWQLNLLQKETFKQLFKTYRKSVHSPYFTKVLDVL